jgi:ferrous iron transport protein A
MQLFNLCDNKNYYHLSYQEANMMKALTQLNIGQRATIAAIEAEESLFHRLSALGFRVGKPLSLIRRANFNGPLHVRLGTTDVILRDREAAFIRIQIS